MEREIIKHLELCATLMSDPDIMRKHPGIVADQFLAAKSSIEALGKFLPVRSVDKCDCHTNGWMDLSVIKNGIGQLVTKLLATHLGTVRLEKFPCVLEVDFKETIEGEPDNYTTREIKETNCMGSIVLLYYYLYWYLFLIRMNQRIDPNYCTPAELDIERLIARLPRSHAFLEFRTLWPSFKYDAIGAQNRDANLISKRGKITALGNSRAAYPFMFGPSIAVDGRAKQTRKTMLVAAYRRALDTNIGVDDISDATLEFPAPFNDKASIFIYKAVTMDTILRGMSVMGGMASVFERSDATQKWKDMHTPIQVLGLTANGVQSKFNGKMATILSAHPYSHNAAHWKESGKKACLYDYCSAALMMDICISFQKLAELVGALSSPSPDDQVFKYLNSFLRNLVGFTAETLALTQRLRGKRVLGIKVLEESDLDFVSKSEADLLYQEKTPMFLNSRHVDMTTLPLWLDEFKNYYPMRQTGVLNDVNRRCFLCDLGPDEGCTIVKWLAVVQSELIEFEHNGGTKAFCTSYALAIIATFMRNSWMVNHGAASVSELIKRASYAPGFRNLSVLFSSDNNLYAAEKTTDGVDGTIFTLHNSTLMGFTDVAAERILETMSTEQTLQVECREVDGDLARIQQLSTALTTGVDHVAVSFAMISDFVKSHQKLLAELTKASNKFDRYPALAWPVVGGPSDNETTNIAQFERVKDRTRRAVGISDFDRRAEYAADRAVRAAEEAKKSELTANRDMVSVTRLYTAAVAAIEHEADDGAPPPGR